jgi:hypothetical protein
VRLTIFVVLLAGCGKSAEQCRTEARELGALLASIDTEPGPIWSTEAKLVMRPELPKLGERAPELTLFPGRIQLDHRGTVTREMFAEALAAAQAELADARRMRRDPPDARRIYVLIDGATPWREVVTAVEAAATAGFTTPTFVFGAPSTATPPPRAAVDDELDRITTEVNPAERATEFAKLVEKQVADCAALQDVFGDIGRSDAESKSQMLIRRLPDALVDCKCDVPMADFRATMWRLLAIPTPMRGLAVELVADGTRIALPAATPWSAASKRLDASTKTVQLALE